MSLKHLLFLLCSFTAAAQLPDINYQLSLDTLQQQVNGDCQVNFTNASEKSLRKIYLHLPANALANSKSLLRRQFIEYQKTILHFADSSETGYLKIFNWQTPDAATVRDSLEWSVITLNDTLRPGESIEFSFSFLLQLIPNEIFGTGFTENSYHIVDWLPRPSPFDHQGFHPYPVSWQRDVYPTPVNLSASFKVPANYSFVSNCDSSWVDKNASDKTYHFSHSGGNFQMFGFSELHQIPGGFQRKIFTPELSSNLSTLLKAQKEIDQYFLEEWGFIPGQEVNLLLLEDKDREFQSDGLITLKKYDDYFKLLTELVQARAEQHIRYQMSADGFQHAWMARGLPYFYKYDFVNKKYPEKKWLTFENRFTRFLYQASPPFFEFIEQITGLNEFDYGYQNEFLFHFLARQGLDQAMATPVDSLSRLNYEAIVQAKSFLTLRHLRAYLSDREFKRGMNRFLKNDSSFASPQILQSSLNYYGNKPTDWYFKEWLQSAEKADYDLIKFEYCPTITTATVKNTGSLTIPYSLTGFKDDQPVLTEWFQGHTDKKSVLMYHGDYDRVELNAHGYTGEHDRRDNTTYNRSLFRGFESLRVRPYQSFENPRHSQLLFLPIVNYNAYDKLLLGMMFYNESFIKKDWEYLIAPQYSFGENEIMGNASLEYNLIPRKSSPFRRIKSGIYGRYYHYAEDLAYQRISPGIHFYLRKPFPTSMLQREFILRSVHVNRQMAEDFDGNINQLQNASYNILNLRYNHTNTNVLHPNFINGDFMLAGDFGRISLEGDFRTLLPNRRWLVWRNFAGLFLYNNFSEEGINDNYYSFGLSGTQDFLFDYNFLGRSNTEGILSRQFFVTDGGFKTATNVFADQWMLSSNLAIPLWKFIGVFGDVAVSDNSNIFYYDYGVRLAFITDFLELYLPAGSYQNQFMYDDYNYARNIRFVLNLDYSAILQRIRWGFY